MRDEGFANKQLEGDLIPVQKAIGKLAQAGAGLEGGDARAAAAALGGGWAAELKRATAAVGSADASAVRLCFGGAKFVLFFALECEGARLLLLLAPQRGPACFAQRRRHLTVESHA